MQRSAINFPDQFLKFNAKKFKDSNINGFEAEAEEAYNTDIQYKSKLCHSSFGRT